ncbi:MAG: hypothetical protein IJ954_03145 [Bacteroidales bacterium]|nr:hypothetical protein [Bacteroidales bacterium]
MKTRLFTAFISAMLLAGSIIASAQKRDNEDWKQKMQSEKIAFLTMEIGLTPEEAQNFWPIYNQISESLDKAMFETFNSYMELEKALNDNKSDKEISKCLEKYLTALGKQDEIRENSVSQYKKILSERKLAKIFVAEEKFRRQHIRRLREMHRN